MSDFLKELNKAARPESITKFDDIKKCEDALLKQIADILYKELKEEILKRVKLGEYETIIGKKIINGEFIINRDRYKDYLGVIEAVPNKTKEFYQYFWLTSDSSNIRLFNSSEEFDGADFGCHYVETSRHSPLFGKPYHTYHLTNSVEYITKQIQMLASNEGIEISSPYILLHSGYFPHEHRKIIQNGGDDRGFPSIYPASHVLLKYSVKF